MIEFRRKKNPHNTSGSVKYMASCVVMLLHSLENGQAYHLGIDSDLHMAVQDRPPRPHVWRVQYFGDSHDVSALAKELRDEQKAIDDVKAKYKAAADARKALEEAERAERASQEEKQALKAAHQLLLRDLEAKYFPDWVKERELKLRFAENAGGANGQRIKDEVEAKQQRMTNLLEMLALAMSEGTSLAFVMNTMKGDPELAPYWAYIRWLVAFHGVSGVSGV